MSGLLRRLASGLRDTARLLSPSVRAERRYTVARRELLARSMERAASGSEWLTSEPYGQGLDERVVELPWVFERLGRGPLLVDVGSTLNHDDTLAAALDRCGSVVFVNPYRDDGHRSDSPRVRYVRGDARSLPLREHAPLVTCLSTLEHVGCDNTRYGATDPGAGKGRREARAAAMRGMRAALAPGGRLLLTVPFGRFEDHGWFEQLDAASLDHAVAAFGPARVSATYFLHAGGWRRAAAADCAAAAYGAVTAGATAVACVELAT